VEDYSRRIPDFLERITAKIRSSSTDRLARFLTIAAAGLVVLILVGLALVFLFIGIFRILEDLVDDMELAYAIVGGLFFLVGVFLWANRKPSPDEEEPE
jgi:hypothetical protein